MSLVHLILEQLAAALDVVRVLVIPTEAVPLALTTRGLPPGAEHRLHIDEERLADRANSDCHALTVADPTRPRYGCCSASLGEDRSSCVDISGFIVDMECRVNGVLIHYAEHGSGMPLVALHGAGVDHREIEAAIVAVVPAAGYRRIYPDLPGMGHSTADDLTCNDDVVTLLGDFIGRLKLLAALVDDWLDRASHTRNAA